MRCISLNNVRAFFRIVGQLNYILSHRQKRRSVWVFASMLILSGLELVGVSSVYPFLSLLTDPNNMHDKWYVRAILSLNPNMGFKGVTVCLCLFVAGIFIIKNLVAILLSYIQAKFATDFERDESTEMLRMYMKRPYEFFTNTNSSIIQRGIGSDVTATYQIMICIFDSVNVILNVILIGTFLFFTDPYITLGALMVAFLSFFLIVVFFKKKAKETGKLSRDAAAERGKCSWQAICGIKEIFVLNRREFFVKKYEAAAALTARTALINGVISACPDRIIEGVCISGFMCVICARLFFSEDIGSFIPILAVFAMGAFKILPSVSKLSSRINSMVYYQFGLQNCYDTVKETERMEAKRSEYGVMEGWDFEPVEQSDAKFNSMLSIENISWRYKGAVEDVLSGLSLQIHKGESVAFIGPSGAGKTTLADVIMGLLTPQKGQINVDGIDIYKIPNTWHKMIGYVPQAVYLIDDTIRANIAFGLPENTIDDDKVWSALAQAQLKEFVVNLPQGLYTRVGERGVRFSGGQRQRIAIARALYEDPDILVLDEATSALDTETETAVMESIEALQGVKTLIIVAHRLTTIRNCDTIYEISNGKATRRKKEEIFGND